MQQQNTTKVPEQDDMCGAPIFMFGLLGLCGIVLAVVIYFWCRDCHKCRSYHRIGDQETGQQHLEICITEKDDQIEELEKEIRFLKQKNNDSEFSLTEKVKQIEELKLELRTLKQKNKENESITSQLEAEQAASRRNEEDIKGLKAEIENLTKQLGQDMNRRLASDETALENINKKNRPTKIVDEYMELLSNQWLGAKDKLDKVYPDESQEEFKLKKLFDILLEAETLANQTFRDYRGILQQVLKDPIAAVFDNKRPKPKEGVTIGEVKEGTLDFDSKALGDDLEDQLATFIKDNSDTADAQKLAQLVKEHLGESENEWKSILPSVEEESDLIKYIRGACALCWKMATQRPPMKFDFKDIGSIPDRDKHDLYYNCSKDIDAAISSYVYPSLLHKEKLLVKGKVFTVWDKTLSKSA